MSMQLTNSNSEYATATISISSEPFSVACWVYFDTDSAFYDFVSIGDTSSGSNYYELRLRSNNKIDLRYTDGSSATITSSVTVSAGSWNFMGAVANGGSSDYRLYVNSNEYSGVSSRSVSIKSVRVGARCSSSPAAYMDGRVAELGIWDTALTAGDFAQLEEGFAPTLVKPNSLQVYYPLIRDFTPHIGSSFTLTNSPTVGDHYPQTVQAE